MTPLPPTFTTKRLISIDGISRRTPTERALVRLTSAVAALKATARRVRPT